MSQLMQEVLSRQLVTLIEGFAKLKYGNLINHFCLNFRETVQKYKSAIFSFYFILILYAVSCQKL